MPRQILKEELERKLGKKYDCECCSSMMTGWKPDYISRQKIFLEMWGREPFMFGGSKYRKFLHIEVPMMDEKVINCSCCFCTKAEQEYYLQSNVNIIYEKHPFTMYWKFYFFPSWEKCELAQARMQEKEEMKRRKKRTQMKRRKLYS